MIHQYPVEGIATLATLMVSQPDLRNIRMNNLVRLVRIKFLAQFISRDLAYRAMIRRIFAVTVTVIETDLNVQFTH